ncbi:hypothetical protein BZG36_00171 [Bifiguratus adelaidae]|uniref:Uncharacterized protein n=1 Tax=Bifiguratus adelaidae TaxID=1938954 RepID=A0A261Y8G7_9FUNG|nr:hypothetical protein BZG36_00171 [Bifiguratus adelaidae]
MSATYLQQHSVQPRGWSFTFSPKPRPSVLLLPYVQIADIASLLPTQRDRHALTLVHPIWTPAANDVLWRQPWLDLESGPERFRRFLDTIGQGQTGTRVRSLKLVVGKDEVTPYGRKIDLGISEAPPKHETMRNSTLANPELIVHICRLCPGLTELAIYGYRLSASQILECTSSWLPHLRSLRIVGTSQDVSRVVGKLVQRLDSLILEDVMEMKDMEFGMLTLKAVTLRQLEIQVSGFSAPALVSGISRMRGLRSLTLRGAAGIDDVTIEHFGERLGGLTRLKLEGVDFGAEAVAHLLEHLLKLNELEIIHGFPAEQKPRRAIRQHKMIRRSLPSKHSLESLTLRGMPVEDKDVLFFMTACGHLNHLSLIECDKVTNEIADILNETSNLLRRLCLCRCVKITGELCSKLQRQGCPLLEHFSIIFAGSTQQTQAQLTARTIARLQVSLPNLRSFVLGGLRGLAAAWFSSYGEHIGVDADGSQIYGFNHNALKQVREQCYPVHSDDEGLYLTFAELKLLANEFGVSYNNLEDALHRVKGMGMQPANRSTNAYEQRGVDRQVEDVEMIDLEPMEISEDAPIPGEEAPIPAAEYEQIMRSVSHRDTNGVPQGSKTGISQKNATDTSRPKEKADAEEPWDPSILETRKWSPLPVNLTRPAKVKSTAKAPRFFEVRQEGWGDGTVKPMPPHTPMVNKQANGKPNGNHVDFDSQFPPLAVDVDKRQTSISTIDTSTSSIKRKNKRNTYQHSSDDASDEASGNTDSEGFVKDYLLESRVLTAPLTAASEQTVRDQVKHREAPSEMPKAIPASQQNFDQTAPEHPGNPRWKSRDEWLTTGNAKLALEYPDDDVVREARNSHRSVTQAAAEGWGPYSPEGRDEEMEVIDEKLLEAERRKVIAPAQSSTGTGSPDLVRLSDPQSSTQAPSVRLNDIAGSRREQTSSSPSTVSHNRDDVRGLDLLDKSSTATQTSQSPSRSKPAENMKSTSQQEAVPQSNTGHAIQPTAEEPEKVECVPDVLAATVNESANSPAVLSDPYDGVIPRDMQEPFSSSNSAPPTQDKARAAKVQSTSNKVIANLKFNISDGSLQKLVLFEHSNPSEEAKLFCKQWGLMEVQDAVIHVAESEHKKACNKLNAKRERERKRALLAATT